MAPGMAGDRAFALEFEGWALGSSSGPWPKLLIYSLVALQSGAYTTCAILKSPEKRSFDPRVCSVSEAGTMAVVKNSHADARSGNS